MNHSKQQPRPGLIRIAICAGLAAATLLVYCRAFDHPFLNFDDQDYVYSNAELQRGLTARGVEWAFTTFECSNWHPLTWLSLLADYELGGYEPRGYHVTNVLLHIVNTLLLFLVFERMTGMMWRSAMVAALFAMHPLHVESVVWVAERKDVLSTLFWMLTLATYSYYARAPGIGRYALVVLTLGLGLMAKPMLVTLPFVLLLLDYWPLGRWQVFRKGEARAEPAVQARQEPRPPSREQKPTSTATHWRGLVLEKVPLIVLVVGSCIVTAIAQGKAVQSFDRYPLDVRVSNALLAYVGYLEKTFWPVDLAVFYPHPEAVSKLHALGAGLMLTIATAIVLILVKGRPYLAVGWFWYLGTLVPVIGLVQIGTQAMADRYTYVPLIGVFVMATWGVADLLAACRLPRFAPAAVAAAVLAPCVVLTWTQVGHWGTPLTLWAHTIAVTENNSLAHSNNGSAIYRHMQEERDPIHKKYLLDRSRQEFEAAIAMDPRNAQAQHNLGNTLWDLGLPTEAERAFREAVKLNPSSAMSRYNLGIALAHLGKHAEAEAEFRRAIELSTDWSHPHEHLGMLLKSQGRLEEAIVEFRTALSQGDTSIMAHLLLCERYLAARQRLPAVLRGEDRLVGGEPIEFAWLCQEPFERRYAQAARFFEAAFAGDPALAESRQSRHRYTAARCAVRAALGEGVDAATLSEQERSRLRGQALTWLQAELGLSRKDLAAATHPQQVASMVGYLHSWQQDEALEGVRSAAALDKLPQQDREAWQKLWGEVETILRSTPRTTGSSSARPARIPPAAV